jgi:hypothetical protein
MKSSRGQDRLGMRIVSVGPATEWFSCALVHVPNAYVVTLTMSENAVDVLKPPVAHCALVSTHQVCRRTQLDGLLYKRPESLASNGR